MGTGRFPPEIFMPRFLPSEADLNICPKILFWATKKIRFQLRRLWEEINGGH